MPDDLKVDTKVMMYNAIAKAPNPVPIYFTVLFSEFIGQSIGGFANDLKIADYGIDRFSSFVKESKSIPAV